ncbi:putative oxidoreductase [Lachnellula hyalina]|uniref:Putative oxidoreductase n=1 Tax=Lachnellula hyalina TaxID=1316788 RepID=A0A8H8U1S7_9HELO|nr:putative oxidoreductase [Lachnellula hyalina]TVY30374.1 putative oxidoreductase [Lachnellula hyalina]
MAPRFSFLGMGGIGKAMTRNIVLSGKLDEPLIIYNRTKARAEEHSASIGHSTVAETIEEAVSGSDIIWSCLQDDEAVELSFKLILQADVTGKLFVDSSSITPEVTNRIAEQVLKAGGEFVAMPVMGEPSMAEKRLLTCIASGAPGSVDRIRPYVVGVVGRAIIDLSGEEPGKGSLLKLMGNVLIMNTMETVAELNVFAEKCGVGVHSMKKLMDQMFPNTPYSIYNYRMLSGGYYQDTPIVEVSKALKLTAHVLELAKSSGASIKGYEAAIDHLKVVEDQAGGEADITGIYGAVRLESGLPFKNETQ